MNTGLVADVGENREIFKPQKRYMRFGDFWIDTNRQILFKKGQRLPLANKCYEILLFLIDMNGHVATREQIRCRFWPDAPTDQLAANLNNAIGQIRKILQDPTLIETIKRQGYCFNGRAIYSDSIDLPMPTPAPATTRIVSRSFVMPRLSPRELTMLRVGALLFGILLGMATSSWWWIHGLLHRGLAR